MQSVLKLILTLTTATGRTGVVDLAADAQEMAWDRGLTDSDGSDETTSARFDLSKNDIIVDTFEVDGAAWHELEDTGDMLEFLDDCRTGGKLEPALRAQLDVLENHYEHDECGEEWIDHHSCGCDDECPKCGVSISPHESVMLSGLNDDCPAKYVASANPSA